MKIVINSKINKKLLANFPQDPYADITIKTQQSRLNLILAYLSIDSQYFSSLQFDTKQIDLSHLQEQSLIKVLKSLYGSQLIAYSVQQLSNIYSIIEELEIEQYKQSLKQSIQEILTNEKDSLILNSIQMLQFFFTHQILNEQLKNYYFDTKLKILQSSKNYLQLNKLSQNTLATMLMEFLETKVERAQQIVNHIMQNYFNRKNIRPIIFFNQFELEQLKAIWQKYHHKIAAIHSQNNNSSTSESINSANLSNTFSNVYRVNVQDRRQKAIRRSQTNFDNLLKVPVQSVKSQLFSSQKVSQNDSLDTKIQILEQQLKVKKETIQKLRKQLNFLIQDEMKQSVLIQEQIKSQNQQSSDKQDTQTSLLLNLVKSKKNKQTARIDFNNIREVQSFQTSTLDRHNAARIGKTNKKQFNQFAPKLN